MKKITFLLFFIFLPVVLFSQQCPEPIADEVQYFCTGNTKTLNDLTVTTPAPGTVLTWYADAAGTTVLPGTTTIVNGTTYYVSNVDPGDPTTTPPTPPACTESDLVPITVYIQSVHFDVSPVSCINLGNNVFLVDPADTVTINLLDINGAPVAGTWSPVGAPLYWNSTLANPHFNIPWSTLYFGNADPNKKYVFTVQTQNGTCPADTQTLTIFTGAYIYNDLCYGATTTLDDIGIPGDNITWYSDAQGTVSIPETTVIEGGVTYYAGFGDPSCPDLLPVKVEYKVAPPSGPSDFNFCTSTTWATVGISGEPTDTLDEVIVCGTNIKWYDSAMTLINNPANTPLVDGAIYYATQTIAGCESKPLKVEAIEATCACLKNDYEYHRQGLNAYQNCATKNIVGPIPLGPTNGGGPTDYIVRTTPGFDTRVPMIQRTSPFAQCGTDSFRINNTSRQNVVALKKTFIAGEVLTFDFALVLQNPSGHDRYTQQPFFVINIFDETGALFKTQCVTSSPDECLFNVYNGDPDGVIVWSDWSCVKFNTIELQGQKAKLEMIVGDCTLTGHWAYAYVDNFKIGEDGPDMCSNSSFGYMSLEPIDGVSSPDYEICSTVGATVRTGLCTPALPLLNPVFPIEVCANFSDPLAPGAGSTVNPKPIAVKIMKNSAQVGQATVTTNSSITSICKEVDHPRDFNPGTPMYGLFTFEAEMEFDMDCGSPYDYTLEAEISGFKICPVAVCVPPLAECTNDPTQTSVDFDLTVRSEDIAGNYDPVLNETIVTYYPTAGDARNKTAAIANPTQYTRPSPGNYTIYARLDFDWAGLNAGPEPDDCYDIIPLQLVAGAAPDVPGDLVMDPLTLCADPSITDYEFDLTEVEPDLTVNLPTPSDYTWDYYTSLNDAGLQQNPIPDPTAYIATIGPGQTQIIYVRVEGPDGCFVITSFELIIYPEIVYNVPTDYELCDDAVADGFTQFNLNTVATQMTTDPNLTVTFHSSQGDADAGTPDLPLSFTNTANPQTITVRIEDGNDCYVTAQFDLIVNPNPVPGPVNDMILCDLNGTGKGQFDLTIPGGEIINGQTGMTVRFYATQAGADAGSTTNQLTSPYTNTSPQQTIYYRLEDTATGCYTTGSFIIEVVDSPPITDPITDYKLCDNDQDGTEVFDLTTKESEILNTIAPGTVTVTYYNTQADANAGIPGTEIGTPTTYPSTGNETIYFRVEFTNAAGCYSVGQFILKFHDPVAYNTPQTLVVCDTGQGNGMAPFDLTIATSQVTGNDPNLSVTYYLTPTEAEGGNPGNQLSSPFTNTEPYKQTIYVRIVNLTTGCYAVAPLDLEVNEAPTANEPAPLTYCDEDNDGLGSFTLTDADAEITGGASGVTVSYHVTFANATNNVLPLNSPFYNTVPYSQIIYARVESPGVSCFSIVEVELKVLDSPQTEKPDDLVACDLNKNGTGLFDLTQVEPQLMVNITNPADFTIKYYATLTDLANDNPIPLPSSYTSISNIQTIYVVVSDINNGCQAQEEFEIRVVDMPEIFHPDPLELCDVNNPNDGKEKFNLGIATQQITNGNTSILISYHETQADACNGTNALPALYTNTVNNQTIYIRAESSEGCVVCTGYTLTLIVNPLPSPRVPDPLEVCDPSSDGFSQFNLEDATAQIKNNEPNTVITYHETLSDAKMGIFPLTSPYSNIVRYRQIVYARSEFTTTGCFQTVELELIVNDTPSVPITLPDIVVCSEDQTDTGVLFDLTVNDALIYGTQDRNLYTLTYHESEQNAIDNVLPIGDPKNYLNTSNPQDIWVRLGNDDSECSTVRKMILRVELAPEIGGPLQMELCADDEVAEFDLTEMDTQFTLGARGMEVTYYEDEDDSTNGINAINPANAYTNIENPQTIYVRVKSGDTGCSAYSTLTLKVNPNPDIETPEPIELCDVNGDGTMEFDLTIREADIRNGEIGTISYHLTLKDAEENTNAILNPSTYTNVESPEQIIYVRVTNDVTGCYSIVELLLIVNPLPVLDIEISDYIICEVETDERAVFDLTTKIPEILNGQSPMIYDVKFYEDEADAYNGVNAIVNPDNFTNTSNPQEIFVRIENGSTECFVAGQSFFLRVLEGAEAFAPAEPLQSCENELGTGIATFDLTQLNAEILGGQDAAIFIVTYHETPEDAETGANPILDPANYEGVSGIIYARVTNNNSGCYVVVEVELVVIQLPLVAFDDTYRLCVDAEGNPIMEESGEASPPVLDTGLSGLTYVFIWTLDGEILVDETSSSLQITKGGVYEVTVIDMQTGCEITTSTTVTVSSPPLVYGAEVTTLPFSYPHTIEATASGLGTYVFQLDNGPAQTSGTFTNVEPGDHIVTISDVNGCGSVIVNVGAIDYPMFFTPNGDGYHDTWNIHGIEAIPSAKIYIFDRHGKLLKQLSPTGPDWDGTFNGNPMPSSDYWFRVIYTEGGVEKEYKGHFTLKR